MASKRKFLDSYSKEFIGIKRAKNDDEFHCVPCNENIALGSTGKFAVIRHFATDKHKKNAKAANTTKGIAAFAHSSAPTSIELQTAAAEGAFAFHICRHNQSFASADCLSSDGFFTKIFPDSTIAKKYSSAQTKTAAIISGVLAPLSVRTFLSDLSSQPFSISIDASNHKTTKLFPLVLRFFTAKNGIETRLLDLEALAGETSAQVFDWIKKILDKHQLQIDNLVAFCADNTPANFGTANHTGVNNVFQKLKLLRGNLIPVGCPAHILHNAARRSADNLPIDIEVIVFKIAGYFRHSTLRVERLKELCNLFEVQKTSVFFVIEELQATFTALNSHGPTRWTTLGTVLQKIYLLWGPLSENFSTDGPLIIRNFFSSPVSEVILNFLTHVLPIFTNSIDALQKDKLILPELLAIMRSFRAKIKDRMDKKFFGIITGQLLRRLPSADAENLRDSFQLFYQSTLEYVDKWFRTERYPTQIGWLTLTTHQLDHEEIIELASEYAPDMTDALFDEISQVNQILKEVPEAEFEQLTTEQKWQQIFNADLPCLYKLVSKFLSIPVSNAFVERVFSLCSAQWTDVRNSLKVETVKSLAQIKVNFDYSCPEFYQMLISNKKLLTSIMDNQKYVI
uniref:HAT C-terminal dimerisation domain-containing protein n=1 Tax=Globodera rostochiensis TaxID=31243 RepID=A0A914HQG9_GLORO